MISKFQIFFTFLLSFSLIFPSCKNEPETTVSNEIRETSILKNTKMADVTDKFVGKAENFMAGNTEVFVFKSQNAMDIYLSAAAADGKNLQAVDFTKNHVLAVVLPKDPNTRRIVLRSVDKREDGLYFVMNTESTNISNPISRTVFVVSIPKEDNNGVVWAEVDGVKTGATQIE